MSSPQSAPVARSLAVYRDPLFTVAVRKCEKSKVESSQPQKAPGGASGDGPAQNNAFITKGSDALSRQETEEIPVTKLPMVHRATAIALDKKARNFAVLQTQPNARCVSGISVVITMIFKSIEYCS